MYLYGIEISNFRSIGKEAVILSPLHKCNILIGQNNAGKSNIIRAVAKISEVVQKMMGASRKDSDVYLSFLDYHLGSQSNPFLFTLHFKGEQTDEVVRITQQVSFSFTFSWSNESKVPTIVDCSIARIYDFNITNKILQKWGGKKWAHRVNEETSFKELIQLAGSIFRSDFAMNVPSVHIIPEFRRIQSGDRYTFSGSSLVELLARYQHPLYEASHEPKKFDLIEEFVQRLLHLPDAKLDVTHDQSTIMLSEGDLRLPFASYGTGVHQLVILITAVLSIENAICGIEEPEIHLHPTLQREFIEFISTETTNIYLLSTHSPTLINAHSRMPEEKRNNIQIFYIRLHEKATVGGPILEDKHSLAALNDLGVKASDILQANCVLWVEGPSDRIYVNHWIQTVAPTLVEGLHYSVMFYGEKLLSHLSATRVEKDHQKVPDELIFFE
jgi:AAA15 family ATPase/GTPase